MHCHQAGINPSQLCFQFSTRHPDLTTCVIGTGDPENVRDWIKWMDAPYDEQAVSEIEKILEPVLNRNSVYGRPENNDPVDGPIETPFAKNRADEILARGDGLAQVTLP